MATGYKGRLLLLSVFPAGANTSNNNNALPVMSARTNSLEINQESVDITTKDNDGWRVLLEDAGMRSMSLSCEGVFTNSNAEIALRQHVQDGNVFTAIIKDEANNTWKGSWYAPSLSYSGTYSGEQVFSITLESAGVISYANT